MGFFLVFLVALSLTGAVNVNAGPVAKSSELHEVLKEFIDLVPEDKVIEIVQKYLETDGEVQAAVEYVQSDGFKQLVKKVESIDDVINFYDYLNEAGLEIYELVNRMHEAIGLPPLVPRRLARDVKITGGIAGLISDIKAILPINEIKDLYHQKLESSPAFAELVDHLRSPRLQELVDALRANEEFQKILKFAKNAGVDVKAIMDLLATLFGLEFPDTLDLINVEINDNGLSGLKRPVHSNSIDFY